MSHDPLARTASHCCISPCFLQTLCMTLRSLQDYGDTACPLVDHQHRMPAMFREVAVSMAVVPAKA